MVFLVCDACSSFQNQFFMQGLLPALNTSDGYVVKLDDKGRTLWQRTLITGDTDAMTAVASSGEHVFVGGATRSDLVAGEHKGGADCVLGKLDPKTGQRVHCCSPWLFSHFPRKRSPDRRVPLGAAIRHKWGRGNLGFGSLHRWERGGSRPIQRQFIWPSAYLKGQGSYILVDWGCNL